MSVNITKVYLLNIPLEDDYKHTFYFNSKSEQESYFKSKVVNVNNYAEYSDFSYQRKDGKMRIPVPYDEALKYNYVMYQNTAYSSKWFYAFIKEYEFKNDDLTDITISTDVMQTWLFDFTIKPSFVEREHVNNDTIGANTVPENLEIGDAVCIKHIQDSNLNSTDVVMGVTEYKQNNDEGEMVIDGIRGGNYNGIYSGIRYVSFENPYGYQLMNSLITEFDRAGKTDAIQCIFIAPSFLTQGENDITVEVEYSNNVKEYEYTLNKENTSFPIKNKKLLTFPYSYLLVSNNNGGSALYKYERFKDNVVSFKVQGALTPGCSIRLIPMNYNGASLNHEEGLNLGKFPICNWSSDIYTNWLTQNSVNIGLNLASGVAQVVGGVAMAVGTSGLGAMVGAGSVAGGVSSIASQLGQIHQMSFTPAQSKGNINCGDVITASKSNTFHYYQMQIKEEYLRIIDEYFSAFGYKVNRIKIPLKNHRENWWFTKTIDANIEGAIPKTDLQTIKNCYNEGITFWKNKNSFKDYSLSNEII